MKKSLLLVTALAMALGTMHASGILSAKTQETPPPKKAPAPTVNLHPYSCDPERHGNTFGMTVSYLGGSYGPTNMLIATDGVPSTAPSTPPSGSLINVGLTWSSGVNVNMFFSRDSIEGPLLFLDYRFLLGTNQTGGKTYPSSTTAPMISTFPLEPESGDTVRVYAANGRYDNKGAQTGTILVGRSLLQKGSTSLFIASGVSIYFIDHSLTVNYNVNDGLSDSGLYTISQTEHRLSGGPEIRFIARKSFGSCFGIDAMFGSYGHLAYYGNTGQESFTTNAGVISYPYATSGSILRTIPGIEVTLGTYYTYHIKKGGDLVLRASWDGGFEPSGTLLASPVVGTSAQQSTLMGYALLNVGATYIF